MEDSDGKRGLPNSTSAKNGNPCGFGIAALRKDEIAFGVSANEDWRKGGQSVEMSDDAKGNAGRMRMELQRR